MNKSLRYMFYMVFLCAIFSNTFANGPTTNLRITDVKFMASDGGAVLIWTDGGGFWRYMAASSGNSLEKCAGVELFDGLSIAGWSPDQLRRGKA